MQLRGLLAALFLAAFLPNAFAQDTEKLTAQVRTAFGNANLKNAPNPKVNGLEVLWAIETTDAGTEGVVVEDTLSDYKLPLKRLGDTNIYAASATYPDKTAMLWHFRVGGKVVGNDRQLEVYAIDPDTVENPSVPKGKVTQMPPFRSKVFEGTERDWWVYVPAQYSPDKPACVMVWQDGGGAVKWVSTTYDNLIAKGQLPVTVCVFVNPGVFPDRKSANGTPASNRSVEYDTLSDKYVRMITEEILPEVEKTTKLRHDPQSRAIAGGSSGGICAFTAAWERPNEFGKVLSWIGSFVNLQGGANGISGGHNYPVLIRKTKGSPKPIRVFLCDGMNDLDNPFGNWPLANMQMDKALTYSGYDHKFILANGFHSGRYIQAILPDALRWLWRDYKAE